MVIPLVTYEIGRDIPLLRIPFQAPFQLQRFIGIDKNLQIELVENALGAENKQAFNNDDRSRKEFEIRRSKPFILKYILLSRHLFPAHQLPDIVAEGIQV